MVRAYNAEEYQEDKFEVANEELTRTNRFAFTVMAIMIPSITLIQSGLSLAVYWMGAHMIEAAAFEEKVQLFFQYGSVQRICDPGNHGLYAHGNDLYHAAES